MEKEPPLAQLCHSSCLHTLQFLAAVISGPAAVTLCYNSHLTTHQLACTRDSQLLASFPTDFVCWEAGRFRGSPLNDPSNCLTAQWGWLGFAVAKQYGHVTLHLLRDGNSRSIVHQALPMEDFRNLLPRSPENKTSSGNKPNHAFEHMR